ncbi:MAG: hypothetical protein WD334_10325 [Chitinophagales bacterium]
MDFQQLLSLLIFGAFIAIRYFMKSKSDKEAKRKQKDVRSETTDSRRASDPESKPSPFGDFFEELEKEFYPEEHEAKQSQKETQTTEPSAEELFSPSEDPEFLRNQEEMQRAAEASYEKAKTELNSGKKRSVLKRKHLSEKKQKPAFNPRRAYMYKELLDRKHFEV